MHTNRVSHQRNVIRLHSYIEYFTRNFLLFPPPLCFTAYNSDDENFQEGSPTRASEMRDVNKRLARFAKRRDKRPRYMSRVEGRQFHLFEFWKQNAHIARAARSPRLQFQPDNGEKSANSGPRNLPPSGGFHSIDNCSFVFLMAGRKRFVSRAIYLLCSTDF